MQSTPRPQVVGIALDYLIHFLIQVAAMLVAVQLRFDLSFGKSLGEDYKGQPILMYAIIAIAVALARLLPLISIRVTPLRRVARRLWIHVLAAGFTTLGIIFLLPDVSRLQLIYFFLMAVLLGLFLVVIPAYVRRRHNLESMPAYLRALWENRILIWVWSKYNIEGRYTQSILGILWIVLVPLATAIVLTLALSVFLRLDLDVPFIVFLFSALTIYNIFGHGVSSSAYTILGSMGIINQVSFPREILVLVAFIEALVDTAFMFLAMLIVNAVQGFWPNPLFILLIPLVVLISTITLGMMLLISYLSVQIRDIPQLVNIMLQLLFYLTPIIFPVSQIPEEYRFIIVINPLAPIVQAFRDIVVYARLPDFSTLIYPLVVGIALLYLSYNLFKANEDYLADLV